MTTQAGGEKVAGISDAAVRERTGKGWAEWIAVLDRAGAESMAHGAMARHLEDRHGLSGWWSQMVAVGYEQTKGLRDEHEREDGFSATVSRTFDVPVEMLFDAWHDDARRRRWYGADDLTISAATRPRSLGIDRNEDDSGITVNFEGRGTMKSQVTVDQRRLATPEDVLVTKRHWAEALDRLREHFAV